jgi:glycogen debranching enzyme
MSFQDRPVGTVAVCEPAGAAAENYAECFVRDFAVSALVFLADGEQDIVRHFLETLLALRDPDGHTESHQLQPGVMPASFRAVTGEDGGQHLLADYGDRAIGRVSPVDSMMWWMILTHAYTQVSGDRELVEGNEFQLAMHQILNLCLSGSFEVFPTLLVPDASCMIDRRMGIHGHPLEIQALFYGMLHTVQELYRPSAETHSMLQRAARRQELLLDYVRRHYWLDSGRLIEIHRYATEEFGSGSANMLNIYPESIPAWVERWMPERGGYLAANVGAERLDVRFFSLGNLLAILFGLTTEEQAQGIMDLYEERWEDLVGAMPLKLCYPALEGEEWRLMTGCDPKNAPWSYHNGGNWPVLLWPFVAAALITRRRELADRALAIAADKLVVHDWPEYYDGRTGRLIGRRANLNQVWSAAGFILSHKLMDNPELLAMFPGQPVMEHV